jgi:hypothetical protein
MLAAAALATVLVSAYEIAATNAMLQSSGLVTYDEFMQRSSDERLTIFNAINAENRAALVREQMTRWQTKNAARLTPEQHQLIGDALNMIQTDMYDVNGPRRLELLEQMKAVETRVRTLFTIEDARNAFTIHGEYIPQ